MSNFVLECCSLLNADYAVAHILTAAQFEDRLSEIAVETRVWPSEPSEVSISRLKTMAARDGYASVLWTMSMVNITTIQLSKCLPDLYWLNVFGKPYVEIFGRDTLMKSPAFEVTELLGGSMALKTTATIEDTSESWNKFKSASAACKEHLNSNAFCQKERSRSHVYSAPRFRFSVELYRDDKLPS